MFNDFKKYLNNNQLLSLRRSSWNPEVFEQIGLMLERYDEYKRGSYNWGFSSEYDEIVKVIRQHIKEVYINENGKIIIIPPFMKVGLTYTIEYNGSKLQYIKRENNKVECIVSKELI